jgi:hypothetical protein
MARSKDPVAKHIVTCSFYAGEPLRYPTQDVLQATGVITGCIPTNPDVCRIETEIELWNFIDKRWDLYRSGPVKYGPPCQGPKSKAITYNCEASSKGYNYRARAYVTIVEDGDVDADVDTSPTRQYHCL